MNSCRSSEVGCVNLSTSNLTAAEAELGFSGSLSCAKHIRKHHCLSTYWLLLLAARQPTPTHCAPLCQRTCRVFCVHQQRTCVLYSVIDCLMCVVLAHGVIMFYAMPRAPLYRKRSVLGCSALPGRVYIETPVVCHCFAHRQHI